MASPAAPGMTILCTQTVVPSATHEAGIQGQSFTLVSRLGFGTFGEVWRCTDRNGDTRAIKLLHDTSPNAFADAEVECNNTSRVLQAARLTHVPDFYGMGEADLLNKTGNFVRQMPIHCMEFIDGINLGSLKRHFRKQEDCISLVAQDIASALAQLHMVGIVHNDVKPQNVLVDRAGMSYLCDFGITVFLGDYRRQMEMPFLGTPLYMAPEVTRSRPTRYDEKVDVWALGVLAYELQVGIPPLVASGVTHPADCFEMLSTLEHLPLEDVNGSSDDLLGFLDACFQVDPIRRPCASKLLQHSFLSWRGPGSETRDDVAKFVRTLLPPAQAARP